MRSFFDTYRWELWLIVGIPVITGIWRGVEGPLLVVLLGDGSAPFELNMFVGGVVSLLLLAVSYPRVRNLGRDFLALLWGYVVAASVIGATAHGVLFLVGVIFPTEANLTIVGRTLSIGGLASLLGILVLLWFARRASRLSLMHAAFLLVYASLSFVGSLTGSRVSGGSYFPYYGNLLAGGAIWVAVVLAKVWLLGNFDRRGARFHRDAVIGLLATVILSGYARVLIADLIGYAEGPYLAILPWLDVVFGLAAFAVTTVYELAMLLALWGLVYLVRVRQPTADAEPELEAPTASPGEER